jgi:hypothetical protein
MKRSRSGNTAQNKRETGTESTFVIGDARGGDGGTRFPDQTSLEISYGGRNGLSKMWVEEKSIGKEEAS